ncbi:hypothetical protein P7C70_g5061, partial [Phenoliferia sp. Uapishka_3]
MQSATAFTSVRHRRQDDIAPHRLGRTNRQIANFKREARQGDVLGRAPRRARVARDTTFDKLQPPEATSRCHPSYQWPAIKIVRETLLWYQFDFKAAWVTSVEAAYWRRFIASEDFVDHLGVRWVTWKRTWQTKRWASAGLVEEWEDEQAPWDTITVE